MAHAHPPPHRSDTKSSLREGIRGLKEDVIGPFKRRLSSAAGIHGHGGSCRRSKRQRDSSTPPKTLSDKMVDGMDRLKMLGRSSSKSFQQASAAPREIRHQQGCHQSTTSAVQPSHQAIVGPHEGVYHYSSNNNNNGNSNNRLPAQQHQRQPCKQAPWPAGMVPGGGSGADDYCRDDWSNPDGDDWSNPDGDFNQNEYAPEDWQQQTMSAPETRAQLLGTYSKTPSLCLADVQGPLRDLDELNHSALHGASKDRYHRTINTTNELSAVASGDTHFLLPSLPTTDPPRPSNSQQYGDFSSFTQSPVTAPVAKGKGPARTKGGCFIEAAHGPVGNKCPWDNCAGTRASGIFEPNRLKEHIRRAHLLPYMCGTEGCAVRKGDRNQIYRHRMRKHPGETAKKFSEQDKDPLAARQFEALAERGISYERVVEICQARTIADLDESWTPPLQTQNPAIYTSSKPQAIKEEVYSIPVSPTSVCLPQGVNLTHHSNNPSTSFAETPRLDTPHGSPLPVTQFTGFAGGSLDEDKVVTDIVDKALVPLVDHLHLSSPQRISRDEHLQRIINHLVQSTRQSLDMLDRRRSTASNATSDCATYTGMLDAQLSIPNCTPVLTNTKSLTDRSTSYGSLNLAQVPPLFPADSTKHPWVPEEQQQQQLDQFQDSVLEPREGGSWGYAPWGPCGSLLISCSDMSSRVSVE